MQYSRLDHQMEQRRRALEERKALSPAEAWSEAERAPQEREKRLRAATADFWAFDLLYFPPEMHSGGYAPPCQMHEDMTVIDETPGVQIIAGSRDSAKTAYELKRMAWKHLTGRLLISGTYSHALPTAGRLLTTLGEILGDNPRIADDWGVEFLERNQEQIRFRTRNDRRTRIIAAFSEGKSVRGFTYLFGRPQFILADDVETLSSPLGGEHTQARIDKISEARASLVTGGTVLWLSNVFDTRCAVYALLERQRKGLLAAHWRVHVYPAWDAQRGPLWPARFPAKTEAELRSMLGVADDWDWYGNYQQDPKPRDGQNFRREFYGEWTMIPEDARGVAWCDPNLALKEKGDITAMGALLYSPTTDRFYARDCEGRSYSDPNDLLNAYLPVKRADIYCMGFDGNVSQESTWSAHVRNWCRINERPFPRLEYRRYRVDQMIKDPATDWALKRILFPPGFAAGAGMNFMDQIFSFTTKADGKPDDAADWLISAYALIHERGLVRPKREGGNGPSNVIVLDPPSMF